MRHSKNKTFSSFFHLAVAVGLFQCLKTANASLSDVVFPTEYDNNDLPPMPKGEKVQVNISLNLRNIFEVNEKAQFITLETSLRMYWRDTRLKSSPSEGLEFVSINGNDIDQFWIPDIFIDQAKALRNPTFHIKPASFRVYPDGLVRYSARVNYDVSCNMDFHRYPVDKQLCEIKYESFGYTSEQLEFSWSEVNVVNPNITLDQFEETIIFESDYATDYYETKFPGLILRIRLERKINYHLIQTYIPSTLFVIIAWLSMWVDPSAIPGRISMVMMTLLTLMAMFSGVRQGTPKVSYISYLDYWMVMCIFFIFLVLIEFPMIHTLIRKNRKEDAEIMEKTGRLLVPILFLCFNIIYWLCLIYV